MDFGSLVGPKLLEEAPVEDSYEALEQTKEHFEKSSLNEGNGEKEEAIGENRPSWVDDFQVIVKGSLTIKQPIENIH